ncbi:MAG: rod shape-determining protein RodA [Bacteroidales bacterium]
MIAAQEYKKLDWWLVFAYIILTMIGWVSIFSSVFDEDHADIFDISQRYGLQFIWIVTAYVIAFIILFILNPKIYRAFAWVAYGAALLLLVAVIFFGVEINGSNSWFAIGSIRFQPAELSKITTALALAALMSKYGFRLKSIRGFFQPALIIIIPMIIIIMQKETGSALVYTAFIFMLYREGLSGWYLTLGLLSIILFLVTLSFSPFIAIIVLTAAIILARGFTSKYPTRHILLLIPYLYLMTLSAKINEIAFVNNFIELPNEAWLAIVISPLFIYHVTQSFKRKSSKLWHISLVFITSIVLIFSVDFFFEKVLQDHQRARIENLLGITIDLKGAGYNVHQSKIAIGSGGLAGKGFLQGTQTKFNFVPEQSTDFIFCTIGEEWGFLGSAFLILLYLFVIIRIINSAEKQKDSFNRIFGYSLASIIFLHFFINIGMTIGIMPVIGIPLPFVSYGGSSLWSFTIFLFIFIRLDLDRRR